MITADAYSSEGEHTLMGDLNPTEKFTVRIIKGEMGFGFTIADSAFGQKVKQVSEFLRLNFLALQFL